LKSWPPNFSFRSGKSNRNVDIRENTSLAHH
jgi:hypothetical protein